jgi:hypothetical protein
VLPWLNYVLCSSKTTAVSPMPAGMSMCVQFQYVVLYVGKVNLLFVIFCEPAIVIFLSYSLWLLHLRTLLCVDSCI